ncbi:MAG: TonB-dependent receptor [Bacteroidales bacterium]|jgi:outer membrane receptor for ferrienterochelin and colicins|nr:TonB-dependent receptor [Bacteroidales bacterium]
MGLKTRNFLAILSLLVFMLPVYALPTRLEGYVTDETGKSLPHVNIMIKNSTLHTLSDKEGFFSLTLPLPDTYTIRLLLTGYETVSKELFVDKDTLLHFTLRKNARYLDAVTVTSTRTPKLLAESPVLTRVITAEDMEKMNAVTMQDVLENELSGIEFTRQMDGQTVINMQGMGGESLLFLVDGERLSGETLNNIDYNRLNTLNIERVEIVKGAASTLYGSNATAGVVNIITKKVKEPWQVAVNAKYGSLNEQEYGLLAGGKYKNFSTLTALSYHYIDSDTLVDAPGENSTPARVFVFGGRSLTADEKITWQPAKSLSITAKGGYFFRDRFNNPKRPDRYRGYHAGAEIPWKINDKHQLCANYVFDRYDKYYHYLLLDRDDSLNYSNNQHTARLQYDFFAHDNHTLTAGAEYFNDRLKTYQFEQGMAHETSAFVLFAQHDWQINKKWNVVYGARVDKHSAYGFYFSPKVSVMYRHKSFTLRTSYGKGFRSPSLKELYTDWDHQGMFRLLGNPDLNPETSHQVIFSGEYDTKLLNISISGFYNYIHDKITTLWLNAAQDSSRYVNAQRADVFGGDINLWLKLPKGFGVRLSYSYVNDKRMEKGVNITDTRPHTAVARLSYDLDTRYYTLNVMFSGRVLGALDMKTATETLDETGETNLEYETQHYPAYTIWKLSVNQCFFKSYTLSLGIDNLFNYKPKIHTFNTSLSPGITFFAGLSIRFNEIFKKKHYPISRT